MNPPRRLRVARADIERVARELQPPPPDPAIREQVAAIIADVEARGDAALVDIVRRFDDPSFTAGRIRVDIEEIAEAKRTVDPDLIASLEVAAAQVRSLAERVRGADVAAGLPLGQRITVRSIPVASVGAYVPGGRAAYPSSLIMAVVPAQVAGVERIAVASPVGEDGRIAAPILAAAGLLGITEVYAVGGPGVIAAFAAGTESIPAVSVISGPGSAWVQEAKRQVFGRVGIDSVAGPSEVVVVAAGDVDAEAIAADLCAQAEHGPDSPAILVTPDPSIADAVARDLEHRDVAGLISLLEVDDLEDAVSFAEAFAPEHLQIDAPGAAEIGARIRHAGAVFLGPNGGTAFGDYVAGSNHILPTGRAARYASSVSPATYLRRMSVVDLDDVATQALAPHVAKIAQAEGFPHHGRSAEVRAARIERERDA